MLRRVPPGLLLVAALLSSAAPAADDPVRPSIFSVTLEGGAAWRDSTQGLVNLNGVPSGQTRETTIRGVSPTVLRLKGDWFLLPYFGFELDLLGDFFKGTAFENNVATFSLMNGSARGAMRAGVTGRFLTSRGFLLSGSLGYGAWWVPIVRVTEQRPEPTPVSIAANGPTARLGLGYAGERFEVIANGLLWWSLGRTVHGIEVQLWLGARVIELGPFALWAGVDASALHEPSDVGYLGNSVRLALGARLTLLPPAPPTRVIEGQPAAATTLELLATLPSGSPAVGAMVSFDGDAPVGADANGLRTQVVKPGAHEVKVVLAGHRPAKATVQAVDGQVTKFEVRLEALTGPGTLSGVVRASATGKPVPEAMVTVGELPPVKTGDDGRYALERVGPGPVQVRVEAPGFNAADEVAQVPPEAAATLDVQLEPLGKGSPATVRGLVRSRTGEALTASVVIKGNPTKVSVTPEGRFFVTVPGGTYLFIISAPGYLTQTKKVVLADGDQAILHTELQKVSK